MSIGADFQKVSRESDRFIGCMPAVNVVAIVKPEVP
jgi:hypothetical protein